MTSPTDKEIKQALAHKVMGYDAWTWDPLNKIEHAMQLVPKMAVKGYGFETDRGPQVYAFEPEYRASFYGPHSLHRFIHVDPARAISMAAYEAVCR